MAGADLFLIALLLIGGFFYFIPSLVAEARKHRQRNAICVLNIFLGWTILGWIGALVWASTATGETREA